MPGSIVRLRVLRHLTSRRSSNSGESGAASLEVNRTGGGVPRNSSWMLVFGSQRRSCFRFGTVWHLLAEEVLDLFVRIGLLKRGLQYPIDG